MKIWILLLLLALPVVASDSDSDSDPECQELLEEFDALVAEIEAVCEAPPPPCGTLDSDPCPPPEIPCDFDACIFVDGFESGDTAAWSETLEGA